jgi:tRNA(fMet)-specific endonuclease VapC
MILLDTDHLSLLFADHPRVAERFRGTTEVVATTIISRIEVLQGRFAFLLKAADAEQLLRAQEWLRNTEADLLRFRIVPLEAGAARHFSHLRQHKKLKAIGRADLLIAAITLAHGATLVSRNVKDFRQVPGLRVENWAD